MQVILIALLAFVIGLVLWLFGYRMIMAMLPIVGFFSGFWLGAALAALVLGTGFLGTVAGWAAGFVLGLAGAALAHFFHEISIGVTGAIIGYAIGSGLLTALGLGPGVISFLAGLVAALIVAALFYLLGVKRIIAMAATAITGANAILLSVLLLFGRVTLESLRSAGDSIQPVLQDSWIWLVVWLALGLFGFVYQNRMYRAETPIHEGYTH